MKLQDLQNDEEFMALIQANPDLEAVSAALRVRGVEISAEELRRGFASLENGELSEDDLEDVAGGRIHVPVFGPVIIPWLWWVLTRNVK